jgi:hypothetical protein
MIGVEFWLARTPLRTLARNVRALLLGGNQNFFLNVSFSARNARQSV